MSEEKTRTDSLLRQQYMQEYLKREAEFRMLMDRADRSGISDQIREHDRYEAIQYGKPHLLATINNPADYPSSLSKFDRVNSELRALINFYSPSSQPEVKPSSPSSLSSATPPSSSGTSSPTQSVSLVQRYYREEHSKLEEKWKMLMNQVNGSARDQLTADAKYGAIQAGKPSRHVTINNQDDYLSNLRKFDRSLEELSHLVNHYSSSPRVVAAEVKTPSSKTPPSPAPTQAKTSLQEQYKKLYDKAYEQYDTLLKNRSKGHQEQLKENKTFQKIHGAFKNLDGKKINDAKDYGKTSLEVNHLLKELSKLIGKGPAAPVTTPERKASGNRGRRPTSSLRTMTTPKHRGSSPTVATSGNSYTGTLKSLEGKDYKITKKELDDIKQALKASIETYKVQVNEQFKGDNKKIDSHLLNAKKAKAELLQSLERSTLSEKKVPWAPAATDEFNSLPKPKL